MPRPALIAVEDFFADQQYSGPAVDDGMVDTRMIFTRGGLEQPVNLYPMKRFAAHLGGQFAEVAS